MSKMRSLVTLRIIFSGLAGLLLTAGCNAGSRIYVTATPSATPQPPKEYTKFPIQIRVDCVREPPVVRAHTIVWNLPGVPPIIDASVIDNFRDSNGPPQGNTGGNVGSLPPCTIATASKLAWSQYNQIFYLYIEYKSLRGWIRDEDIEVL